MTNKQEEKAIDLFYKIQNLGKEMDYSYRVDMLKGIVQNPDFARKEDF